MRRSRFGTKFFVATMELPEDDGRYGFGFRWKNEQDLHLANFDGRPKGIFRSEW